MAGNHCELLPLARGRLGAGLGWLLVPPLKRGAQRPGPAPQQQVQVGPALQRRHLLPHHWADAAVSGPEILPVPLEPGRPRPGLGQDGVLFLLPKLEYNGTILAHHNLCHLGSSESPPSVS
uniref:cDNA FLJ39075 fis, clone NT2RP7016911 n=1 Tax=Homo sapiens TaxID=9606 RepID=Q8N8P3_HUMAN